LKWEAARLYSSIRISATGSWSIPEKIRRLSQCSAPLTSESADRGYRSGPLANAFDSPSLASRYEEWYVGPGRRADQLEKRVLGKLLTEFVGSNRLLEVGCGTGHFARWFAASGLAVVGLDLSRAMLAEARRRNGIDCVLGDALSLPFRGGAFDLTAIVTTLEFVADPRRALSEAVRVSRRGILLGVLNRWSVQAVRRKRTDEPMWQTARFFSAFELKRFVRQAAGDRLRNISWRTTLWPLPLVRDVHLPFGDFIGMAVYLRPREGSITATPSSW
jgi:ubiquinone/menaquinone biosynthesis C-methylase UbiE